MNLFICGFVFSLVLLDLLVDFDWNLVMIFEKNLEIVCILILMIGVFFLLSF